MFKRLFGKPKQAPPVNFYEPVNRFFATYDKSSYSVVAAGSAPTTEQGVLDFERRIGYTLPTQFRMFTMSPHCGLYIQVKPEIWPQPEPYAIRPVWSFQRGVVVYGLSPVLPPEFSLQYWHEFMFTQHGIDNLLPFMSREGSQEKYCFTPTKEIVLWDPAMPEDPDKINLSFVELLTNELYALDERRQKKQRGEDLEQA